MMDRIVRITEDGGDLGGTATTTSASTDLLEPLFRSKEDDCEPCPAGEYGLAEGGAGNAPQVFSETHQERSPSKTVQSARSANLV